VLPNLRRVIAYQFLNGSAVLDVDANIYIYAKHVINTLIFVMVKGCALFEVRPGFLNAV
jgi:hypothetical protein